MMTQSSILIINIFYILILGTGFLIITQKTLSSLFSMYAAQSLLISVIAFIIFVETGAGVLLALALLNIITKVIIIPYMLRRTRTGSTIWRDSDFRYLSPVTSILVGMVMIFVVYNSFSRVVPLSNDNLLFLGAVTGVSLALTGMMVIFSRKKVVTKIVGYLMMENGILLFGLFIAELPFIIELLIIVDLLIFLILAAVLAFGIESTEEDFQRKLNDFTRWFKK